MRYYDEVREQVSLLLAAGHQHARRYPLATVGMEARIVRRRINNQIVTESTLMHACIGAVMNGKAGAKHYSGLIKELNRE